MKLGDWAITVLNGLSHQMAEAKITKIGENFIVLTITFDKA